MKDFGPWIASLLFCVACTVTSAPPPQQPTQPPPTAGPVEAPPQAPPPPASSQVQQPPPAPPPPPGPGVAADNGQPKMHAAFNALNHAGAELQAASPNKGGHREKAMQLIQEAMAEVKAGIEWAEQHPSEVGPRQPPAKNEPVPTQVAGAEKQQHMAAAMVDLREARRQLSEAETDKGGHRVKAIELIDQAERQVHDGIEFADHHH